jgi:hypothetical protein
MRPIMTGHGEDMDLAIGFNGLPAGTPRFALRTASPVNDP